MSSKLRAVQRVGFEYIKPIVVAPLLHLAAKAEKGHRWQSTTTPMSGLARWNTALVC
jgi:hypothetical protein